MSPVLKKMESKKRGKAQTVLGLLDGNKLGFTLPHEHLSCDIRAIFMVPSDPSEREKAYQPVTPENLGWVRSHRFSNLDNLHIDDEETAVYEAICLKEAGANTITDVTPINIGRNPSGLVHIAQASGINVIMGTSYYTEQSYHPQMHLDSRTEDNIADEFIRDITTGVNGICAGIIGEIGCSWPLTKNEQKVLRAAAMAQQETGAAISIHVGPNVGSPFGIAGVLKDAGADLSRVIMGHITRAIPITAGGTRRKLAETGCYLEYDMFGQEEALPKLTPYHMATDIMRINQIIKLITEGCLNQILISHDVCQKIYLSRYGGSGYTYILKTIIPIMRSKGISEEQIYTITVENPKRVLTFA